MENKYLNIVFLFLMTLSTAQTVKDSAFHKIDSIVIKKGTNTAQKTSYIFNKERLIKNIKIQEVVSSIPHITVANDKSLSYKGNRIQQILINNVKSSLSELNSILAEDITSIEIIYSNIDLTSGENKLALNIKTKFKPGVKGYLEASPATFQEFFYEGAGLSINNKNTYISIMHSNLWNANKRSIDQSYLGENKSLLTSRNLYQPFNSISVSHILKNKSFNFKFLYSGVKENSSGIIDNSENINNFNMNSYNFNFLYDWTIGKYTLKLNSDFVINDNFYKNKNYTENQSDQSFKEFAVSPFFIRKINKGNLGVGIIYTDRTLDSQNRFNSLRNENKINQSIYNAIFAANYNFNKNFSFTTNLKYQYYKDNFFDKDLFLPYVKILKTFDKIGDIELVYKRNIARPNIYTLSGNIYNEVDRSVTNTNPFLRFQESDLIDISLTPLTKKVSVSFGISHEKLKNQISTEKIVVDNYINNNFINTRGRETALNISMASPISENFNVNTFYKYIYLTNTSDREIFKGNYSVYNFSLNGKILKNYNFSINSSYRSKIYDANYFIRLKPDFGFTVSKSFKDNLFVSLEFRNILDNDSRRQFIIVDSKNNQFTNTSYVNSRLLLLTLTYNFGKSFYMKRKNINNINSDILPK